MPPRLVYLDYNATTPMDIRVLQAMNPFFTQQFGNAASNHAAGIVAKAAVEKARTQVAAILRARADEIVFTSGATESNNLAIKGIAEANPTRRHIITQQTEHKAVLDTCLALEQRGWRITWLKPTPDGTVTADQVAAAMGEDTSLVTIMWANNEIGTVQPVRAIGAVCRAKRVAFHTDATQAVGKLPIDVNADNIDLLSLSAHKLYGPKGAGALFVRSGTPVQIQMDGGGHERGMRSGTLNVPGIVGLGAACAVAAQELPAEATRLATLRDQLEGGIIRQLRGVTVNGSTLHRLPHCTNLSFAGVDGEALLAGFDEVCISSGSACTSALKSPSFVLKAIDVPDALALASVRYSLGRMTTQADIDAAIMKTVSLVNSLRPATLQTNPA
ncbi:MAG TPA: cysteine desulfurase family protein [Tepidisphaeraceae bacterium]|nr:cysteine desulfurase family protein [Tepidisphaeraceae bacterium]